MTIMRRRAPVSRSLLLLLLLLLPVGLAAAPRGIAPRPDTPPVDGTPAFARRVAPAMVGLRVQALPDAPSSANLGAERAGSAVIFDPAGYALSVSYLLLDAERIEVTMRDGLTVPARLVGLDLETGVGVIKLNWAGPWPAAPLGDSSRVTVGDGAGTLGVGDGGELVAVEARVRAVQRYTAPWEYMLDRAFVVAPANPAFGGGVFVDATGAVVGVISLRLGDRPFANLAIPIEKFLAGREELLAKGRVASRGIRPWLGLYTDTVAGRGVVVTGVNPVGPAGPAGFRRGDVILTIAGRSVASQEEFYGRLWETRIGEPLEVLVQRESGRAALTVRPADRYRVYRTTEGGRAN
jgi:S1-C subfamily serine protease